MVGEGSVKVPQTLADGWAVQRRVIHALLMREVLTRFGRHNIGFLWMFVEPMVFTLFVAGLWTLTGMMRFSNLPIVAFAITGYTNVLLWRNSTNRMLNAVEPNASLMYHRYVKYLDVLLARGLLEVSGVFVAFSFLVVVFALFQYCALPEDPLKVLAALLLLGWFGVSLGLVVGPVSERGELVEKIWHPLSYIMFPLSGAAFLVDSLPTSVQGLALLLPMVNGVEMLRDGYFGSGFRAHYDIGYLVSCNLALTFLGLSQVRVIARGIQTG